MNKKLDRRNFYIDCLKQFLDKVKAEPLEVLRLIKLQGRAPRLDNAELDESGCSLILLWPTFEQLGNRKLQRTQSNYKYLRNRKVFSKYKGQSVSSPLCLYGLSNFTLTIPLCESKVETY